MPEIFSKNAKINVVEYGEHACLMQDLEHMKVSVMAFFKKPFLVIL